MIEAVIFDLDGVLLNSEKLWDRARREVEGAWYRPVVDGARLRGPGAAWYRPVVGRGLGGACPFPRCGVTGAIPGA